MTTMTTTERLTEQLHDLWEEARALTSQLSDTEFLERPAPGQWSVSECLIHINVIGRAHLADVDDAIEYGHDQEICAQGPFSYGLVGGLIIRLTEPPVRMRVNTSGRWTPTLDADPDEIRRRFDTLQSDIQDRLARADGLDLDRLKVPAPFAWWHRFSLYETFSLILAHERRHLWQARRVLEAIADK